MESLLFFKAALIGLSIAAPVGPIGLLCMQRSLGHGAWIGFLSGLGAASADACYGALGAFGVSAITQTFVALAQPLAWAGGLFLAVMGLRLWRTVPAPTTGTAVATLSAPAAFASVFALTLTNPLTILSFVAVFASLGGGMATTPAAAAWMVAGVFTGSALWWLALAIGVAALRQRIDLRWRWRINRATGLVLMGMAAWQMGRVLVA